MSANSVVAVVSSRAQRAVESAERLLKFGLGAGCTGLPQIGICACTSTARRCAQRLVRATF